MDGWESFTETEKQRLLNIKCSAMLRAVHVIRRIRAVTVSDPRNKSTCKQRKWIAGQSNCHRTFHQNIFLVASEYEKVRKRGELSEGQRGRGGGGGAWR
jgi:hypothetical protein